MALNGESRGEALVDFFLFSFFFFFFSSLYYAVRCSRIFLKFWLFSWDFYYILHMI
jgi:hypothetical protein